MSQTSTSKKSRAYGCLFGQAIGDSLGCHFEFKKTENCVAEIDQILKKNSNFLPILGGGPFNLGVGQITDDTEMALALARTLNKNSTDFLPAYQAWKKSNPPDIGITTRAALTKGEPSSTSLSNGQLMRCSPLGIYLAGRGEITPEHLALIEKDVRCTHSHPLTINAVTIYVITIKKLIETGDKNLAFAEAKKYANHWLIIEWLNNAEKGQIFPIPRTAGKQKEIGACDVKLSPELKQQYLQAESTLEVDQLLSLHDPIKLAGHKAYIESKIDTSYQGYVGVAFTLAFYHLLHSNNLHDALVETLKLGGDTDTNGCIVAALLGAYYGIESLPEKWIQKILDPKYTISSKRTSFPDGNTSDLYQVVDQLVGSRLG